MLKPSLLWHYLRWKTDYRQSCGSGMFIPDPGSWFLPITDLGSRIQKQQQKRGVENKFVIILFFVVTNFTKLNLILFFNCWRNSHSLIKISISDPDWIRIQLVRSVDPDSESGSESKRAKMTHKSRNFLENSCFEVLDVLFWGLKASSVAWKSFMEA